MKYVPVSTVNVRSAYTDDASSTNIYTSKEREVARIQAAGGKVMDGRVDGGLALSRAFGDYEYKMRSDLPPFRQKVSALPDVRIVKRLPGTDPLKGIHCYPTGICILFARD